MWNLVMTEKEALLLLIIVVIIAWLVHEITKPKTMTEKISRKWKKQAKPKW